MATDAQPNRRPAGPLAAIGRRFLDAPVHMKALVAIGLAILVFVIVEPTMWVLGAVVYFVPSMVAWYRGAPRRAGIFVLNLFLGWTFLGWVGALVWAVIEPRSDS